MTDLGMEVFGDGEPAVFVHGSFGWGIDTFSEQIALQDGFRIVLIDRRGFGKSQDAASDGWPTDKADLAGVLDEIGPAHLAGHSYGGIVALLAAGLRPSAVRSLVGTEPTHFDHAPDSAAAREMALALGAVYRSAPEMDTRAFADAWGTAWGRSPEAQRAWVEGLGENDWAAAEATRRERYPGDAPVDFDILAAAAFPKVVVSGGWPPDIAPGRERARDALNDVADAVAVRIGAEREVFPRSSHGPQWEEPQAFNEFLRKVWTSTRPPR
jgi:pimeloyl-ACP methyl ester carboxylesterase